MSTQFEEKTKTICFDLVGRIQDLDKVAHDMRKTALIEPGSINNHVDAIVAASEADKVELLERLKLRASNWGNGTLLVSVEDIDSELATLRKVTK